VVWQTGSDHLSAFTGLGRRAPWLALPMAVCLFSLVGLPPLGGFAAKWFLLIALGKTAAVQPWLWGLVIVAVINTAISLYYYARIVRQMFLTDDAQQPAFTPPAGGLAMVNACAIVLLLLGTLWFSPLGRRAESMASYIFEQPVLTQPMHPQAPQGLVERGP
jgi:NADH-quinone oxidoreductase subunit N